MGFDMHSQYEKKRKNHLTGQNSEQGYYQQQKYKNDYVQQDRGGCLTAFILFVGIVNGAQLLLMLASASQYDGMIMLLAVSMQLGILVSAAALWNYKIWGLYGLMAGYAVGILANLALGTGATIIGSLIGMAILYWLVEQRREMFD